MTIRDLVVKFGFDVDRSSERQAENSIKGIKNMATKLLGSIAVVFSVAKLTSFAKDCVQAASDVEEMENKFDVVFGEMRGEVDQWAKGFADSVGRNKNAIKRYLADQQNLLVGFGMAREEGAKLAEEMTSLALDIASFANQDEDVAVNAMTKAVMGESEAAKTLGAVLNDTTRAETMRAMGLTGNYNSLDQLTKMQVNYNTILRQSPDAIGDCVRSMDSYEARQRQLSAAAAEFKEFIGGQLLPILAVFIGWITQGVKAATGFARAILLDKEENNRLLKVFERIHAVVKRLQPAMERFAQSIRSGISRATDTVKGIAGRLGGMDNLLKILAVAAGAFLAAMNWGKVIGTAKSFLSLLFGLGRIFSFAHLKVLAVVAVIAALALVVEDFIHFLLGNDSVIGTIFDRLGIGADNARQAIFNAFRKIRDFLLGVWDFLKTAAGMWIDAVKGFFERHGESIRANFERVWGIIKTFLEGVWTFLSQLAAALFGSTEESIDGSAQSTKEKLLSIWQAILDTLSAVWDALYEVGSAVFHAIATVIETVFGWIQTFWNNWGARILDWFKVLWKSIGGILNGFLDIVKGVANFISSVFTGNWRGAWNAIKQIFAGVWNAIVNFLAAVWDTIKMVFEMALAAIRAIWEAVWDAIAGFFRGVWDGIVGFFQGAIDAIVGIISPIAEFFTSVFQSAWDGICAVFSGVASFFTGIWDSIVGIFSTIGGAISDAIGGAVRGAINNVLGGAAKIINGFISAINFAIGVINKIPGVSISKLTPLEVPQLAEGGIATKTTNAIIGEGSEPEAVMPLSKLGGMISGYIRDAKESRMWQEISLAKDMIGRLCEGVSALGRAATASAGTAGNSTTNNSSSSVTQNVEINNSYSGGEAEAQRNMSKGMKKSATDATTQMARALAYARG